MFTVYSRDVSDAIPMESIPATIAVKVGDALIFSSGAAALATGTSAPVYISAAASAASDTARQIPVIRVDKATVYQTKLSEASAAIAAGTKYTRATTGDSISATATGGVAEVVSFDGKAEGDFVRVRL